MEAANREEGSVFMPKFDADGLIPAIVQDKDNGEILMVGYMNQETLNETIAKKKAVFWSRSRQKRWMKGETSGHVIHIHEILTDCDQDVVVLKASTDVGVCHVGYRSCFYRRLDANTPDTLQTLGEKVFDPNDVYKK